jgi:hypothetical protein
MLIAKIQQNLFMPQQFSKAVSSVVLVEHSFYQGLKNETKETEKSKKNSETKRNEMKRKNTINEITRQTNCMTRMISRDYHIRYHSA